MASYKEKKTNRRSQVHHSSERFARPTASWYLLRTKTTPCCHCKSDLSLSNISSFRFIQQHRTHLWVKFSSNNINCVFVTDNTLLEIRQKFKLQGTKIFIFTLFLKFKPLVSIHKHKHTHTHTHTRMCVCMYIAHIPFLCVKFVFSKSSKILVNET